jgi:glycosyltransferase involved in cell wall biosynthesis
MAKQSKVALLGMKGNFNKDLGQGVQKYAYKIWENLQAETSRTQESIVNKIELGSEKMAKPSFTLASLTYDFSNYDIIHMPVTIAFNPLRKGKAKTLTTAHEFYYVKEDNPFYNMPRAPYGFVEKATLNMCRRQMLSSDYLIADSTLIMEEAMSKGYPRERIFLINIGIDQEFIDKPIPEKKEKKGFTVGRVGSFGLRKNVAFSINAFKKLPEQDMTFEIWGKHTIESEKLGELAKDDKRIQFKGFAPQERLVDIYDSFDVYVHPILYTGFEMEILEAASRGIPVIIAKHAQVPEEVARYTFKAEDETHMAAIIQEIRDNGYLEAKRKEAMEYARGFTWQRTAQETLKAYASILL